MWRVDRFKEFRFRVRCAGLESDPEFAEALGRMAALTRELSEMSAAQVRDASEAPWWRDGEYDEARAEEANDDGMRKIGEQRYEEAFEAFTEAIRLEPRRAVYHRQSSGGGTQVTEVQSRRGRRRVRDRARFQLLESAHSRRYGEPAVEMCGQGVEDV